MKHLRTLALIFCALTILAVGSGCDALSDYDQTLEQGETALLRLSLLESDARTALPVAPSSAAFTCLELSGAKGAAAEQSLGTWASYAQFLAASIPVRVGTWHFTLSAAIGGTQYEGSLSDVAIKSGENHLSFSLSPVAFSTDGSGNITISVAFNADEVKGIKARLYDENASAPVAAEKTLSLSNGTATYSESNVSAGNYVVIFSLYANAACTVLVATISEAAQVTNGVLSTSAITVQAVDSSYTISLDANGGSVSSATVLYTRHSGSVSLPTPTRLGYTFAGWYEEGADTPAQTVASDEKQSKSYTAHWTANTYTVRFDANGGSGTMEDQSFTYDTLQALRPNTFTRNDGLKFVGWKISSGSYGAKFKDEQEVKNLVQNGTITLYAHWGSIELQSGYNIHSILSSSLRGAIEAKHFAPATALDANATTYCLSSNASAVDVLAWYDETDNTIYYYAEGYTDSSRKIPLLDADYMFWQCSTLETIDLSGFETSNMSSMFYMFSECQALTTLDLSGFDTSNVESMSELFFCCTNLQSLNLTGWNTSKVKYMNTMFSNCRALTTLNLSGFDTSNVESMTELFSNCTNLQSLNLSGWNTSKVKSMDNMFFGCSSLGIIQGLDAFDTASVTNMNQMFYDCSSLASLTVTDWKTSNVTTMYQMFSGCSSLSSLDIRTWNTEKVENMWAMFSNCSTLATIIIGDGWNVTNVLYDANMFAGCTSLKGGNDTVYDANHVDRTYARADMAADPGYLTKLCTVVFVTEAASTEMGVTREYTVGKPYRLPAPAELGLSTWYSITTEKNPARWRTFDGWSVYQSTYQPGEYVVFTETGTTTVSMLWRGPYIVTFDASYTTPEDDLVKQIATQEISGTGTLMTWDELGFEGSFVGWCKEGDESETYEDGDDITLTEDITLKAKWRTTK